MARLRKVRLETWEIVPLLVLGFERQSDLIVLCHDCHRDHHKALTLRAIRATEHTPLAVSVGDVLKRATA
jgi:hypothetical protein